MAEFSWSAMVLNLFFLFLLFLSCFVYWRDERENWSMNFIFFEIFEELSGRMCEDLKDRHREQRKKCSLERRFKKGVEGME